MNPIAHNFLCDASGVTAIEYGLLAALIAALLMGIMSLTGLSLQAMWQHLAQCLATPTGPGC